VFFVINLLKGGINMRTIITEKNANEDLQEIIARARRAAPTFRAHETFKSPAKTLEEVFGEKKAATMRREAAGLSNRSPKD
jgi:hypothetical protein